MNPRENQYIDIHTHHSRKNHEIFAIQNLFPEDYKKITDYPAISMGIHPWFPENWENKLVQLENSIEKLIFIGEAGLDKACETPMKAQEEILIAQLNLARKYNKPVIIHCVKTYSELLQLKKKSFEDQKWIFHGFNSSIQIAEELIDNECYIAFGKHLLIQNSNAQKAYIQLPLNRIFFETDDEPDLQISTIYEKGAMLKKEMESLIKDCIRENYYTLF